MLPARQALLAATAVVPHTDADGLAAGAIALRARGEPASAAILLGRGENPWGQSLHIGGQSASPLLGRGQSLHVGGQTLHVGGQSLHVGPLAVLDWGVRALPPGREGSVVVDHHAPEADAIDGSIVVSSFGEQPEVPTAPLMRRIVPEAPAWLAAVGGVGDVGDRAFALPECAGAGPKTAIRKLVSLVNAPRRLPDGPVRTALALLVEHDDPKAALADARTQELEEAKQAWRAELDRVIRTAPQAVGDVVMLIRFASPAQVHPLVATTWSRRLAPRVVLAANDGYLGPGIVNFAVRGGPDGTDLRQLLKQALPGAGGEFAHGHPRATGGSLATDDFARLLAGLAAS